MHTGQIQGVTPFHGSVSQPSIEELATEYVILMKTKDFHNKDVYHECFNIKQQIQRRIGVDNAQAAINNAEEIYKLLVPSDPA